MNALVRGTALAGAAWGAWLSADAAGAVSLVAGRRAETLEITVARVLGARHLVQGLAVATRPRLYPAGAAVDLLHAGTMVALAAVSDRHRRLALTSAAVAATLAAAPTQGACST